MENRTSFYLLAGVGTQYKDIGRKGNKQPDHEKEAPCWQAFRMAANGLHNSKSPIGDYYRRIKAKAGAAKAAVATARKPAIIYYRMISDQPAFNPKALEEYQEKYKQKKINQLKRKLELLEAT